MKLLKTQNLTAKQIILTASFLTTLAILPGSIVQAQDDPLHDMEKTPEQRIEFLIDHLDLSEVQAEAVRSQMESGRDQARQIFDSYGLTSEDARLLRQNMRAIRADFKETMQSILNEEQLQQLQELQKDRHKGMGKEMN